MKKIKADNYTQNKKLICAWTEKQKYLIQYKIIKFYVRRGLVVEKFHEKISFKQSQWLEKYIDFNTQMRNLSKMILKKISINYSITRSMERQWKMYGIV